MPFDYQAHFERSLGSARAAGEEVVGDCPFCGKDGKLWANGRTGMWTCFRCDEGGGAAKLIAELEGITREQAAAMIFRAAVTARRAPTRESLVDKIRAGLPAAPWAGPVDEPLPDGFVPVWDPTAGKWQMPVYLLERGVTREAARHFGLGFCNRGRFGHRIIVPVACPNGSAWVARATDGREPKYLNPPRSALGRLVMGWEALTGGDFVLVEGAFDVVRLWQHGIRAVATLGKVLHSEQFGLLRGLPREATPTVMLDPEEYMAPYKMASRLRRHFRRVHVAALPAGVDPGSSTVAQARDALAAAPAFGADGWTAVRARL